MIALDESDGFRYFAPSFPPVFRTFLFAAIWRYRVCTCAVFVMPVLLCSEIAVAKEHEYVRKHKPIAKKLERQYGIPQQVILGIALVETGSGKTRMCRLQNNHFGIIQKGRQRKKSRYRHYSHAEASYRHFCELIAQKKLYQRLKGNMDYKLWIDAISKTGYAGQPAEWKRRVLKAIRDNNI